MADDRAARIAFIDRSQVKGILGEIKRMKMPPCVWTWTFRGTIVLGILVGGLRPAGSEEDAEPAERAGKPPRIVPKGPALPLRDQASPSGGKLSVIEAHGKTKLAKTVADYTAIIDHCQDGIRSGLSDEMSQYARSLLAWAYNRRGQLLVDQGHATVALADFEAAVENDKTSWRAVHNRGVSYATMERHEQAIDDFNRTLELKPDYWTAYFNRGEVRYQMGQFTAAVADYTRAIELAPQDAASYNSRGHAHYRLGKDRQAMRDFTKAVEVDPKNVEALANRGDLYAELGFYAKAVGDYQQAVRLDPHSQRALQSAAWLMATCPEARFRSTQGALENAAKALELNASRDHRFLDTLAAAEANAGNYAEAQEAVRQAMELAPPESDGVYRARLALYEQQKAYRTKPRLVPQLLSEQQEKKNKIKSDSDWK
jgi:tetratricopeptide (TPR) repeat protein